MLLSGYCDFENGLCGLTSDNSTEFQWSARSGKTPSENSGPAFDHTTYTDKGTCATIFHVTSLLLSKKVKQYEYQKWKYK